MERKIGETFEFEGHKLKVVDKDGYGCDGCFFLSRECSLTRDVSGFCSNEYRTDKKRVIFVEAKDEQPQELNLCEILKDCPKGEKFWSPMLGAVKLHDIIQSEDIIIIEAKNRETWEINSDGTINIGDIISPEIMLYPSKEMRDWSKFTAPWYKKEESIKPKFKVGDIIRHKETNKDDVYEISKVYDDSYGIVGFNWGIYIKYQDQYELIPNKFDPKTLKAFDRVLVRFDCGAWSATLFSHLIDSKFANKKYDIICCGSVFGYCIPYNEETKHLVGTTDEAPEYYRYWEE